MNPKYSNKTVYECCFPPCTNRTSEWGGKLRACSRCSVAGKGVALYCSVQCQKDDWPRHKVQCNEDREQKHRMTEQSQKTLEDMIIWDRKNRPKLVSAAISALDLCHHPENADEYVFFVVLADTPGVKYRYQIAAASPISFDQYEELYGGLAGDPRNDQRIGQERAKAKSATCISFQIVECVAGCRNTFQTWMMPKDMHGYRVAGFGVPNWIEILRAGCARPRMPIPPIQTISPNFNGDLQALRTWRDMYMNDIYSAAIDALNLVENPSAAQQQFMIIYLRYTGSSDISQLVTVENAFVFSLEEAEIMLDESVWTGVKNVVNGRPRNERDAPTATPEIPAPCVVCQMIDPLDPGQAPAFTVSVKLSDSLHQERRPSSWKQHLVQRLGGGALRMNPLLELELELEPLLF